ncbi:MAG: catalase [Tardiphaga sp.]|nr:catalase [Tardiphaga sp.]
MAKSTTRPSHAPATATIHDQQLVRGAGGELHQIAEGETPLLTTAQGGPVLVIRTH